MIPSMLRIATFALSAAGVLQAATADLSNLNNCINDVRQAAANPFSVPTFDSYKTNYKQLVADLQASTPNLPYVYQQTAAKPLLEFIQNLGEWRFLQLFAAQPTDGLSAALQQIIPDAALAILSYKMIPALQGISAFEEVISDLYDGFLSDEDRVGKQTGMPIEPPTYGVIPPLVKFGNADSGPYTWPGDATSELLGMGCGVVSLPPAQLQGGLIAWATLGHETSGHDITHADKGLLDELTEKVRAAVLQQFNSPALANYWANCIDETTADVCGYLNMGPSVGGALIGYFRALGDGRLRSMGSLEDTHPIDLLRGYLAAAVVKHLNFQDAASWSQAIAAETHKDDAMLYLVDRNGVLYLFPVSFAQAIASTDVVAQVIMQSKLESLQRHSLQQLQDWRDEDQAIVDNLVSVLNNGGHLPTELQGPGFYAAYVVAAATQAALQGGANIPTIFSEMQNILAMMHLENPTWSQMPTDQAIALLERRLKEVRETPCKYIPLIVTPKLPEPAIR